MNAILVLVRKDFALFLKDRASISLTFIVPFALIYLFGQIYHVNSGDSGPSGIPVAVVNQSDNPAAARLVDALKAEKTFKVVTKFVNPDKTTRPLTEEDLRPLIHDDAFRFALVIPRDVIRTDDIGVRLRTYSNPRNAVEAETVEGILQKTLFSKVPELLGQSLQARARSYIGTERLDQFNSSVASAVAEAFGGDEAAIRARMADGDLWFRNFGGATGGTGGSADALSRIVKIDDVQVEGKGVKSPMATLLVGGWAMQFLLFAVTASATALFREKEHGIFQRVLSAPVTRGGGASSWSKSTSTGSASGSRSSASSSSRATSSSGSRSGARSGSSAWCASSPRRPARHSAC